MLKLLLLILLFPFDLSAGGCDQNCELSQVRVLGGQINWYNQEKSLQSLNQLGELAKKSKFSDVKSAALKRLQKIVSSSTPYLSSKFDTIEPAKNIALSSEDSEVLNSAFEVLGIVGQSEEEKTAMYAVDAIMEIALNSKNTFVIQGAKHQLEKVKDSRSAVSASIPRKITELEDDPARHIPGKSKPIKASVGIH